MTGNGLPRVAAWLDPPGAVLAQRLIHLALRGLPQMYRAESDEFAFTRARPDPTEPTAGADSAGTPALELRGTSLRYGAIVALGAAFLDTATQRQIFHGRDLAGYLSIVVEQAATRAAAEGPEVNLGDLALVCWATAQAGHADLDRALALLRERDAALLGSPTTAAGGQRPEYVVEAAWVVAALAAARAHTDVEEHLKRARDRLLGCAVPGSPVFPHTTGPGLVKAYRAHVACFADQVYPIQALARLHHTCADPDALAAAQECAAQICRVQGESGQWWWHYDSRTGSVIEGYPVYSVHQHAMAPMALLDLAEAGGRAYREAIGRGLAWLTAPAELCSGRGELAIPSEPMILDDAGVTWRKVYRGDPHKVVRGVQTVTTRAVKGLRVPGVGLAFPPGAIDRECRPYEFGWLLYTWLGGLDRPGTPRPDHTDSTATVR